ncbi:ABC transporter ATP-binding protein [Deinococcus cellulosilyticus]|uniref:ABC transporter permease n=1 Tax=Deinococcus cellulosilyticus (strain DSM 18568 / NBRC 106333 / KACC 11606 / 5516J-15) TaxID=1223518 RepID=A0A511N9A4_DEIC1|nr:ABC transporter ATP-binding protein [Deinococcus cellulosilyticus]GEM49380.1 ABC transporter permease [Deinococcus cellulosilyticus NBRC 106333 = KACC 11606]
MGPETARRLGDLSVALAVVWQANPIWMLLLALGTLALALTPAAGLWVNKLLLDALAGGVQGASTPSLVFLLFLQAGVLALGGLLSTLNTALQELLGARVQERLSLRLFAHAAQLPLVAFESPQVQDGLRNAHQEVSGRAVMVWANLLSVLQAVVALAALGGLMLQLGPSLLPLVLLAALPSVLVQRVYAAQGLQMALEHTPLLRLQAYLGALLTTERYAKEVRSFGLERHLGERWQDTHRQHRQAQAGLTTRRSLWSGFALVLSALLMGLAGWGVVERTLQGQLTLGDVGMFLLGASQVQGRLTSLLGGVVSMVQGLTHLRLLFGFLEQPLPEQQGLHEWTEDIVEIEFCNVSYIYPGTGDAGIRNMSFRISRGESLALVGRNGAGKSTLVKLLLGLYQPTSGVIRLNGKDATLYSATSISQRLSTLFQDHAAYHLTVRDNVMLGDVQRPAQPGEIHNALRRARADFVASLPQGIEQQLGAAFAGGVQLSGGQWQRLALGRMLYRSADVLVLDEPGAALDPEAEQQLLNALYTESSDQILVLVSHRLATVRQATLILRLEKGQLAEAGSHEQLMAAGNEYARLFRLQAAGYSSVPAGTEQRVQQV